MQQVIFNDEGEKASKAALDETTQEDSTINMSEKKCLKAEAHKNYCLNCLET